ncbi:tyrosine phosphatase family protein [Niveispirillum irakense]|uniref:tyrosine phosphatase family protein n=1 Tax=Niveispirillum irakense TaxID=34011 RepID=UPI000411B109|nr:protein-tyrosine-phosphatase [Niveispirillum irakense]
MSVPSLVPFRLTVCGIDELGGHCAVGVSHVLSIMDPGRETPPAFGAYGEHARLDMRFDDIIEELPGKTAPEEAHLRALLDFGRDLAVEPVEAAHLLVHCHMGISRSTAAMTLILAQTRPDRSAADALAEVVRIRPRAWPNLRMLEMGGALLGCQEPLLAALRDHYRQAAVGKPEWIRFLLENNRRREVDFMHAG